MRSSLFIRFLLITALLFAQTGGLMHGISHTFTEQQQDQSLPHDKLCQLCASYTQLGSALGSHVIQFGVIKQRNTSVSATTDSFLPSIPFSAFAARAPPLLS